MRWFTKKVACVHCKTQKTKREFENQATCTDCQKNIQISREPQRACPVDGTLLEKHCDNELIIDRCPKCDGIWLDAGELEIIKAAIRSEGMGTGVALGMIIN